MKERTMHQRQRVIARLRDGADKKVRRYMRMYNGSADEGLRTVLFEKARQAASRSNELDEQLNDFRSSRSG